jgi:hypothetical protein
MTTPVPVDTDFQRLVVEQALALAREMEAATAAAPPGRVLDRLEALLLTRGREFLLRALESAAQHTADEGVKKGGQPAPASAATACGTRGTPPAPSSPPLAPSP